MLLLPPLDLTDVSILLVISGILLVIAAELPSYYHGSSNLMINKKRLENAAIATGILFLATVAIRILGIILGT